MQGGKDAVGQKNRDLFFPGVRRASGFPQASLWVATLETT